MTKLKFRVGQLVRLKGAPHIRVFVLETSQQTCYAQCEQNWYTGRVMYQGKHSVVGKVDKFSEIELEEVPEPSDKLNALLNELTTLKNQKAAFLKDQDFEKAAAARDEYRKKQLLFEEQAELEGLSNLDLDNNTILW